MKSNNNYYRSKLKGIRFNTWLIFTLFAMIILVLLWLLQLSLLKPYYRSAKINSVSQIAETIEKMILEDRPLDTIDQLARDNSLCIVIVDNNKHKLEYNGIGSTCYISKRDFEFDEVYTKLIESENYEYDFVPDSDNDMVVLAKLISPHLGSYTLLINAIVTPEKAGLILIQNQFVYLTMIVLIVATIASIMISKFIADPFVKMTSSAKKLAHGDFDINFGVENKYLNEFDDLAEALNYATLKLKQINELRVDLLANVTHDIKTPLTNILAYTEMITDFSHENKQLLLEHLEVIESEAKFLDKLVENMLELSMIESGNLVLDKSKFNLIELAKQISSHFNFNIQFISNSDFYVYADQIQIGQVIYNLINNAINHSDASQIIIKTVKNNDYVRFSVIDNGKGIDESQIENIWDRYFKIDKNFHRQENSSGLGLSISKGIILAHEGIIDVKSSLNKGSEFYFELLIENN